MRYGSLKPTNILIIILSAVLFFTSCGRKDNSISMKELKEMGMPDCNKIWTGREYSKAYGILMKIKNNDPYKLPRKESKKSGEVFDRLINRENMNFLYVDSIPLNVRAQAILRFLGTYEDVEDLYYNILMKKQYYTPELIEIYLFGLDVMQEMIILGEKIDKSTEPDDVAFQQGFPAIRQFYITMVTKRMKTQTNIAEFKTDELEKLCDGITTSVSKNIYWFDQKQKDTLKESIQTVINSTTSEKIRKKYETLLEKLNS